MQVGKQSKAAMSMCLWVRAMDTYATVYRIVEPKRQALAAAQAALDASNAVLAEKQEQLKAIREKVAALQRQLADTQKELASLQFQVGTHHRIMLTLYLCHNVAVSLVQGDLHGLLNLQHQVEKSVFNCRLTYAARGWAVLANSRAFSVMS